MGLQAPSYSKYQVTPTQGFVEERRLRKGATHPLEAVAGGRVGGGSDSNFAGFLLISGELL